MTVTIGTKEDWGGAWPPRGEELMGSVRKAYGRRALLAFSRGKDAIVSWLAMRDHFEDIVPVHFILVPGLSFVDESLDYYERFFGRSILRLPHPSFYNQLRTFLFQPPSRIGLLTAYDLPPEYDYQAAHDQVREHEKLKSNVPCANGIRAADSPMRRVSIMTHGPVSYNTRQWSPIWDFKKDDILRELDRAACKLPVDYRYFGRTFDGLDYRFLKPLKEQFPDDYRKVLDWFPLAELSIWRVERMA
jgi:hypothetical protein